MDSIPLPSHIHYELLLQLLERQSLPALRSPHQEQVQQLIVILRKALAQQKQLEEHLQRCNLSIDFRWSLNAQEPETSLPSVDTIPSHLPPQS
jgi:hypothetical protein